MAKASVLAGATSQSFTIFIQDSSSTVGAGLAGLAFNTSGLIAYYTFTGANAAATAITLATLAAVNSAYSSGGFKEIDATNMKGAYRLDVPNAAIAASKGRIVTVMLSGATNMAPLALEIELTGWDNQDATNAGLSKLTSLTFTGANKVDASVRDWIGGTIPAVNVTGVPLVDLKYTLGTISPASAGSVGIDWAQVANKGSTVSLTATTIATLTTYTGNTPQTGDNFPRLGAPAGASIAADLAEIEGETDTLLAGVNVTQWAGQTALLDTNNLPKVDVEAINASTVAAVTLAENVEDCPRGACSGGTLTTAVVSSMTNPSSLTASGQLIGRTIIFDADTSTGALQSQASNIAASTTGATPTITFTALTTAPGNGDTFSIV